MKHEFSKDLFDRYVEGKCTEEERAIVEGWYLNELKNSDFDLQREKLSSVQQEIWSAIKPLEPRRPQFRYLGYAAALVLGILVVGKIMSPNESSKPSVLSKVADTVMQQDSVIFASKLEKRMIRLPDSSIVILDKGSRLTVLPAFNRKYNREVELEGKAYFDIAHNPSKPFIVYTGSVRTTVLGTAFDITTSPKSNSVKVNVIRGLVEVKNMKAHWITYLKKNMQVVSGDSAMISKNMIDATAELSWNTKDDIKFDDVSFKDAKQLLQDRFKVRITMTDTRLQSEKFSTVLRTNETLDHFLEIICNFNNAEYHFNSDSTEVSIKPLNRN